MLETHPFGIFVPPKTKYLLLGSFPGKISPTNIYDWFYGTKRNHFWPILREVYKLSLQTREQKQALFTRLSLAIGDIILQCERKGHSNLDMNLTHIVYNTDAVAKVLENHQITTIFFSSRFVESSFNKHFKEMINKYPNITFTTLPSPSPRYAAMTKAEKIIVYQRLLPQLR